MFAIIYCGSFRGLHAKQSAGLDNKNALEQNYHLCVFYLERVGIRMYSNYGIKAETLAEP
jgi:carbon starvation protein CstA